MNIIALLRRAFVYTSTTPSCATLARGYPYKSPTDFYALYLALISDLQGIIQIQALRAFNKKVLTIIKEKMSAYRQILYHIVFRTKGSKKSINQERSADLYKYIWGIIKNKKCILFRINGMEDHLHILSDLHPSVALADYIRDIKVSSAKWMKDSGLFPEFEGWGIKYCALTYSHKERDTIINYIKNQQEHHKEESFQEEIKRFFHEQGISLDEKWFWVDS